MSKITQLIDFEIIRETKKQEAKAQLRRLTEAVEKEVTSLLDEAEDNSAKIVKKLETFRKKIFENKEYVLSGGGKSVLTPGRLEARIAVSDVAKIIDVPHSQLTLYLLNNIKTNDKSASLIEYSVGMVCFYSDED